MSKWTSEKASEQINKWGEKQNKIAYFKPQNIFYTLGSNSE